jgi:hypothetical protein
MQSYKEPALFHSLWARLQLLPEIKDSLRVKSRRRKTITNLGYKKSHKQMQPKQMP